MAICSGYSVLPPPIMNLYDMWCTADCKQLGAYTYVLQCTILVKCHIDIGSVGLTDTLDVAYTGLKTPHHQYHEYCWNEDPCVKVHMHLYLLTIEIKHLNCEQPVCLILILESLSINNLRMNYVRLLH